MNDDALSRYVRLKRKLDPDWRVFRYEAIGDKIRITGAIARPATRHDNRPIGHPVWLNPLKGKAQITVTPAEYRRLLAEDTA